MPQIDKTEPYSSKALSRRFAGAWSTVRRNIPVKAMMVATMSRNEPITVKPSPAIAASPVVVISMCNEVSATDVENEKPVVP